MPDTGAQVSQGYILAGKDRERRRLALQASILEPYTDRFLRDAGIAPDMHVLDMGCGVGDVSLLLGRLVGSRGTVTGVDLDSESVMTATQRAKEHGLDHVRFVEADLSAFQPATQYDAVMARHVLIHTPDPVALLRRARSFVRPGGILAVQEFDLVSFVPNFPQMPLWNTCADAVSRLFERAGLPGRAGTLLYTWFMEAGLPVPQCRLEFVVEGGEDSRYPAWLAETMQSLSPKMVALGIMESNTLNFDQLQDQLRSEAIRARHVCLSAPMGGAFVRVPAN